MDKALTPNDSPISNKELKLCDSNNSSVTSLTRPEQLGFDDKDSSESGRFKFLLGLLRKLIGVSDIINLRISLPSQILDPVPNLEHLNWIDRPDYFANIGQSDDSTERFISVLKYCFSKDCGKAKSKLKKPYNSILGEHFLCYWNTKLPESGKEVTVTLLNEQTSHHPPVSAFYYNCTATGVSARGNDHIAAKFTGTAVKVTPGELAKGIYINLENHNNEEYHITHANAVIQGWLTGSLYLTLQGRVIVSCADTKIRAVYDFKPESWLGRSKYALEGKVFKYNPTFESELGHSDLPEPNFSLSSIPDSDLIGTLSGSWKSQIFLQLKGKQPELLLDVTELDTLPKQVKSLEHQDELESRRVWQEVTENILSKEFSKATAAKVAIEDRQREKARIAKENDEPWIPRFFTIQPHLPHIPILRKDVQPDYGISEN